jgi:hypothetical protein
VQFHSQRVDPRLDCAINCAFPLQMAVRDFLAVAWADTGRFGHVRAIRRGWVITLLYRAESNWAGHRRLHYCSYLRCAPAAELQASRRC